MTDKTGGPAFPLQTSGTGNYAANGMTLRDYFAAKAMQSMCVEAARMSIGDIVDIPKAAYALADAMLAERAK